MAQSAVVAVFTPVDARPELQAFAIAPSDGRVMLGRGPLTGITSSIVSRKLGEAWVAPDAAVLRFEKASAGLMYHSAPGNRGELREIKQGETVILRAGAVNGG